MRARVGVPVSRAIIHAVVAPVAVAPARIAICFASVRAERRVGAGVQQRLGGAVGRLAQRDRERGRHVGEQVDEEELSRVERRRAGERRTPTRMNPSSPRLPPTRIATASRTESHIARPSAIASTMVSMRSSTTMTSASARAAAVPRPPSAMPASASRIAAASLAPSPVIATVRPARWYASTMRTLWSGATRANTETLGRRASGARRRRAGRGRRR